MFAMGMADEARRAAEQYKASQGQRAVESGHTEAWFRQTIDRLAAEFASSAREMNIKPMKRKFAKMLEPKYFGVFLSVPGPSDGGSYTWRIFVRSNGDWKFVEKPFFPAQMPYDAEAQLRKGFTTALTNRAQGFKESHAR